MDYEQFKNIVIAECKALGIKDYELYYANGESTSIVVFAHEVNRFSSAEAGGLCFRCLANGKMGYASTEKLDEENAKAIVRKALDNTTVLEAEEEEFLAPGGQEYAKLEDKSYPLPSTEELIKTALSSQEKLYSANKLVIDGTQTQTLIETNEVAIYNSKGLDLHQKTSSSGIVLVAVVSDGKEMANNYEIKLGQLSALDIDKLVKKCTDDAAQKLGGEVAPTGQYPVIFSPEAMSDLLETYESIFSSEAAQKGLSMLKGKEGEVIASPCVTIVDDPMHKDNPEPRTFDDEGCPTKKKNVIENGVLNTLLYNMKTAAVEGKKTTGNASKPGYAGKVGISPFTMYIQNGEISEEELLTKAGNGVYINDLGGLHAGANAVSGDFSLQSSGFMIENGKKTTYVKSFTVAGNFYTLLKNIRLIANNGLLPSAMSSTAFGSPSVLVDGLSVAGK